MAREKLYKNESSLLRKIQDANTLLVVYCNDRLKVSEEKIVSLEGRARISGRLNGDTS